MNSARIAYAPRPDATQEAELNTLAAIYKFLLESEKAAPRQSGHDEVKGSRNDSPHKVSIP